MKKNKVLFLIIFIVKITFSQVSNSVLSKGEWYKFSIDSTGVYKIDKSLLQKIGISTKNLNPKKIHIYGNGGQLLSVKNSDARYDDLQETAIFIDGEDDEVFNNNDYILFYAKGPHDWVVNTTTNTAIHRQNIYEDKAYYFITVNTTNGKRIDLLPEVFAPSRTQITTFDEFLFYEKEEKNLFAIGQQWFGENFSIKNNYTFQFPFSNAVINSDIKIKVRGVASSTNASSMLVKVNTKDAINISFSPISPGSHTLANAKIGSATIQNSSNSIVVSISYNNGGIPSADAYLDFIEIVGKKNLKADNNQFSFRSFQAANTNEIVTYKIQNASNIFQLWDVTDFINPKKINNQSSNNMFSFKANGGTLKEYVVVNSSNYYLPKIIKKIKNQNIHHIKDINYLIITNLELLNQAQRLAKYHQNNSNLTTKVVVLDEIYNEFSSGSKDITGIRDFIKHVYTTNTSAVKKLKYICFFGDTSYDYKDRIEKNNNIVPAYEAYSSFNLASSYVTDDFFVMLDDNEGDMSQFHTVEIATGRLPVSTINEAKNVVDKILSYYKKEALGDWRNTITLLADDIDQNADITLQSGVETIADEIKNNKPIFNINKIYADAYVQQNSSGGERYPEVKHAITNAIEKGTLLFDYFGHGGEDGFASERFLEKTQINALVNPVTLPLFITVTCEFSRFDNPNRDTAGEFMFLNKRGGATSMITTAREVYISTGQSFNKKLMRVLLEFTNEDLSIAASLAQVKNNFPSSRQKFFIYFFGDPAMKLAIPKPNVKITKMNGVDVTQSIDTLKALSKVTFQGVVTDAGNNILNNFNGTLSTLVYDKPIDKTTLDNDNFGVNMVFDSQESKLFRGKSSIEKGVFNLEFIVPKDIKIAYGKGKLSFYAENGVTDKAGVNFDIIVGGINENATSDTVGPEIQLFLNDESFIDGGNTNSSPNLIVSLSDSSGINTSVTAIDHDIVAILDENNSKPILLNDYYQTELNDFTKGKVTYKLRNLSAGTHTLKIKAWDTYNNSSTATLTFVVVSDAILNLENVLNYPNPFINYTEFWFNHNKPNELLKVQVQIFTISGKLIKTINQDVQTLGTLSRNIIWNGLDDFGNKIGKGVYIYKLKVKSTISNLVAEKYEKLVILQ